MTKYFFLAFVTALVGCAAYHQVLFNADGAQVFCDSADKGLIGANLARISFESCIDSRRAAGYLEVQSIGAIGATFNEQGSVLRIVPNGPAMRAGLKLNDQVLAVNGISVNDGREMHALLFVPSGTTITLQIKRNGIDSVVKIKTESWSSVNGFKTGAYSDALSCSEGEDFRYGQCYPVKPMLTKPK